MKTHKLILINSLIYMLLPIIGGNFIICKSVAYAAEDNLVSLQRDVLAAKEKQAGFAAKVDTAQSPAPIVMKQEAANLISEMTNKPTPVEINTQSSPAAQRFVSHADQYKFQYPNARSFEAKPSLEPRTPWLFNRVPKFFAKGKNDSYELTDGNALYKVAISDGKITMREAVDIALANSIAAQALKKKIEVAEAKLNEAKRGMYPTVQLQYDENGGHAPNGQRFYRGRDYKINMNQPLYYGGELVYTVKQAEEGVKTAKADFDKAKNELVGQVQTAYYGVIKAEYNAQYQADLLKEIEAFHKIIKNAYSQKLVPHVDYLNMESQMQQVKYSADSSNNDVLAAYLTLRQAMSLDSMVELPVDLRLKLKKITPDFNLLLDFAMKNNPDLLAKQLAYFSAQDGIKIYEAKKKPRFDLRGSYGMLGEVFKDTEEIAAGNADLDLEKEWYLGIHGSLPLGASTLEYDQIKHVFAKTVSAFQGSEDWRHTVKFSLLDKFSDVTDAKNAEAALLQAEADWQKVRNDIIYKLKDQFYALQKAMIQMDATTAKMRYQEKQNNIFKYSMMTQDSPASSYMDGLIEQAGNRFAFIQAVTDYNTAVSTIAISCGNPNFFDTDEK